LGEAAFGNTGKAVVCGMICMQNTGAMTSYLVVIGDIGPSVIELAFSPLGIPPIWYVPLTPAPPHCNAHCPNTQPQTRNLRYDRDFFLVLVTLVVVLPLSMLREIGLLGYTSTMSICCLVFFAGVVIYKQGQIECEPAPGSDWGCEASYASVDLDFFLALPTMCFSFLCHTCLLPVFKELDAADQLGRTHRPKTRIQHAARFAIGGSAALYFIVALFGYLTFYRHTNEDLLKNLIEYDGSHDSLTVTVQVLLLLSFIVTIPLINFPLRRAVEMFLYPGEAFSWWRHGVETTVVIVLVLILAIKIPNITTVARLTRRPYMVIMH